MTYTYVDTPDGLKGPYPSRSEALDEQKRLIEEYEDGSLTEAAVDKIMSLRPVAEWVVTERDKHGGEHGRAYWEHPKAGVCLYLERKGHFDNHASTRYNAGAYDAENDYYIIDGTTCNEVTFERALSHLFSLAMRANELTNDDENGDNDKHNEPSGDTQ